MPADYTLPRPDFLTVILHKLCSNQRPTLTSGPQLPTLTPLPVATAPAADGHALAMPGPRYLRQITGPAYQLPPSARLAGALAIAYTPRAIPTLNILA